MKRFWIFSILLASVCNIMDAKVTLPPVFADNMVLQQQTEVDDQHGGNDLEEVLVESQPGAEYTHDGLLQQEGQHAPAREGGDLTDNGEKSLALALKDPDAVGHVGEGHGGDPGDDVGAVKEDGGGINGLAPEVVEQEGYRPVHGGGESAEDQIQDHILVFFQKLQQMELLMLKKEQNIDIQSLEP